jgi:hypothetical protein
MKLILMQLVKEKETLLDLNCLAVIILMMIQNKIYLILMKIHNLLVIMEELLLIIKEAPTIFLHFFKKIQNDYYYV